MAKEINLTSLRATEDIGGGGTATIFPFDEKCVVKIYRKRHLGT